MIDRSSKGAFVRSIVHTFNLLELRMHGDERLDKILELETKDERAHRKMGARFTDGAAQYAIPVSVAARLNVMAHLARDVDVVKKIDPDFVFGVRLNCLYIRALAILEREKLLRIFTQIEWNELAALDYAAAVRGEAWS